MIKRFFSFILLILATGVLFCALTLLILRQSFVNENLYLKTYEEEEIYSKLDSALQNSLESYLEQNIKVSDQNQFGPKFSTKIALAILNNIDKELFIKTFIEGNTKYLVSYLKGEDEIKLYFPRKLVVDSFSSDEINLLLANEFIEISGFSELPDCQSGYIYQNLDLANGLLPCKIPDLEKSIINEISSRLPQQNQDQLVEGFLSSIAPNLDEEMKLSDLTNDQNLIDQFSSFSKSFEKSLYLFLGLILIGSAIALLSSLLSPSPALNFLKVLIYSGILMIMFSLVGKFVVQMFLNFYVWSRLPLPPDIYSEEQRTEIINIFRDISGSLLTNSLTWVIIVGAILIISSVVLIILFKFAKIIVPEEHEEVEDPEEMETEKDLEPKNKEEFEKELLANTPNI